MIIVECFTLSYQGSEGKWKGSVVLISQTLLYYFQPHYICTSFCYVVSVGEIINSMEFLSLSVPKIPLNEVCGAQDVCLDQQAMCAPTGTCQCMQGYTEKAGVCGKSP